MSATATPTTTNATTTSLSSSSSSTTPNFGAASTAADVVKGLNANLKGVYVLVTGGTSGIGVETVRALYEAGAHVTVTARDSNKGESVLSSIRSSSSSSSDSVGTLSLLEMDLSSLASIRTSVSSFLSSRNDPLHVLINNAAVAPLTYQMSHDNLELTYAVNTAAPLLLSLLFTPLLHHSSSPSRRSRIINVASAAHGYVSEVLYDFVKLQATSSASLASLIAEAEKQTVASSVESDHYKLYASSKLALILLTREYARLYSSSHLIDAVSVHPGVIRTPLNESLADKLAAHYNKNVQQGAATTVWATIAPAISTQTGLYFEDCMLSKRGPACVSDFNQVSTAWSRALEYIGWSASSLPLSPSFPTYPPHTPTTSLLPVDLVQPLSDKVVLVTGATNGIGVETARCFASHGAHVFIVARNPKSGQDVIRDLQSSTGNTKIEFLECDLTSFDSVSRAAAAFRARQLPLHYLILNAGIMACPSLQLVEGHEQQFTVCHLSHFLLTRLLEDVLVKSAPARVVVLSSVGHKRSDVRWDDINFEKEPYNKWTAYGQAKTANIYFAFYFNHLFAKKGVNALAVHPGGIMTGLQKDVSEEEQIALGWRSDLAKAILKSVSEGASTTIYAAASREMYLRGGAYCEDCHVSRTGESLPYFGLAAHIEGYRHEVAGHKLWTYSEKALSSYLPQSS